MLLDSDLLRKAMEAAAQISRSEVIHGELAQVWNELRVMEQGGRPNPCVKDLTLVVPTHADIIRPLEELRSRLNPPSEPFPDPFQIWKYGIFQCRRFLHPAQQTGRPGPRRYQLIVVPRTPAPPRSTGGRSSEL